jgi:hypothetical protein
LTVDSLKSKEKARNGKNLTHQRSRRAQRGTEKIKKKKKEEKRREEKKRKDNAEAQRRRGFAERADARLGRPREIGDGDVAG